MQPSPGPYGAPAPPAPYGAGGPLKPSGWWYLFAGLLGVGGVVLAFVVGFGTASTYSDTIDDFQRVDVPGRDTVRLEAGDYTVYHEYFGADDEFGSSPNVDVSITGPDGDSVPLDGYTGSFTYSNGDHEGEARYTFDADETGDYEISTEGDGFSTVAIGEGIGRRLFAGIAAALGLAFVGLIACAVIAIVVAVKRSGAKTRRHLATVRQGWGPPPTTGSGSWPGAPGPVPPFGYTQPPPGGPYPSGAPPGAQGPYQPSAPTTPFPAPPPPPPAPPAPPPEDPEQKPEQ